MDSWLHAFIAYDIHHSRHETQPQVAFVEKKPIPESTHCIVRVVSLVLGFERGDRSVRGGGCRAVGTLCVVAGG